MKRRFVRGLTSGFAMLIGGLFSLQCIEQPGDFIAPTSDIQLSIPLADITRTLEELFSKDTSTVKPDGIGGYVFEDTQEGAPTKLDSLKVKPQPSGSGVEVGVFQVAGIPSAPVSLSSSDLGVVNNTYPVFPGISGPMPSLPVDFSSIFDFMAVNSGSLLLTVTNSFPVPITFSGPIVLRNGSNNATVASFTFATLQPGASDTQSGNLAGKFVEGSLQIAPVNVTAGSGTNATFNNNSKLTFDFSSSAIFVDSAAAIIPSQPVTSFSDSILVIDDSVTVTRATFSSGRFIARFNNNLGINVGIKMEFANFQNPVTGSKLVIEENIAPYTVLNFPVSLDTTDLVDPIPDAIGSRMQFSVHIETINSGGVKSTITKNDFVLAQFLPQEDFVLSSVTGRIKPTLVPVNSGASGANLGEAAEKFSGNFTFDSVRIAVDLGLSGGFPIGYDLVLWARNNKTGIEDSLIVPPPEGSAVKIVNPGQNQFARIVLGNSTGLNTFLSRFVPNLPDTFVVRGQLVVNPNFGSGVIQEPTEVFQRINTYFPLRLGLANGELDQPVDLEGESFPTDFIGDVKESSIRVTAHNRLPLGLSFRADLYGPNDPNNPLLGRRLLGTIPRDGVPRMIGAATVDVNGNTSGETVSQFRIDMTPSDVDLFNKADTMYIRLATQTSGGGSVVRLRASDFIRLRMSGNLVYTIKGEEEAR